MRKTLFLLTALCATFFSSFTIRAQVDEPFGVEPIAQPTHPMILREWKSMPQKMLKDAAMLEICREDASRCTTASLKLKVLIDLASRLDHEGRLFTVNVEVNRLFGYTSDVVQWGSVDGKNRAEVWSSPLDVIESGKGDCEESVNSKLFVLWQAGVSLDHMRLVLLDYGVGQFHIVLAVRTMADWVVLDDLPLKKAIAPTVVYVLRAYDLENVRSTVAAAQSEAR